MKPSTTIRSKQTREILRAGRHAWKIERDLNQYVVINFAPVEGDELRPQRLFRDIRRKVQSWLYYKRRIRFVDPLTDVRVWENADGLLHINWVLHIPAWLQEEFSQKLPIWISSIIGSVAFVGGYKAKEVYNLNGLLKYILKGTQKPEAFDIRPSKQGEVWGRRAVASTCLGKTARERDKASGRMVRG